MAIPMLFYNIYYMAAFTFIVTASGDFFHSEVSFQNTVIIYSGNYFNSVWNP